MEIHPPAIIATPESAVELDRLGDEIAELSATGRAFPRKRRGAWRATPAGW